MEVEPMSSPILPKPEFAAWIGIDWADQHHDVALHAAGSDRIEQKRIQATPEALSEWIAALRGRFRGQSVGVCLEQSKGALIHALLEHDFLVLYPINPSTLDQFRKAFATSGAKSDPSDAALLLELLEKHGDRLHAWKPEDPKTRALARFVEARRKAVDQRTRFIQRLNAELKGYFPQALEWAGQDLSSAMASDFLRRWPTLQAVQRARSETLRRFYTTHHCRSVETIQRRIQQIRTAVPLLTDPAIVEPSAMTVQLLAEQLRPLAKGIKAYDTRIQELFAEHPDSHLFDGLPGSGAVMAPRLLAAFGADRSRYPAAANLQQYSGIAPVTEASGKSRWVHRRWAAPKFVRQTFHEFAGHSIRQSVWARAYYDQMRSRGKGHHAAVRALAFKWIRILWRCWQDQIPYDEALYVEALRQRGSSLVQQLPALAA
ncbi:MAG: IS110 family transposase [Gemmatimonas sp.]|nr:IS110 family transposase [Gemmatimonas sp.]